MTGKVLVDDVESPEGPPPSRPPPWLALAGAAAVAAALAFLPGQAEPPEPTVTLPEVELAEDRWAALRLPGSGALSAIAQVAGGGLVAVGEGPQVWSSSDRLHWSWAVGAESPPGELLAVVPFQDGAVAVGSDLLDDGSSQASIWHGSQGSLWQRIALRAETPSALEGVAAGDGTLVAWGWEGSPIDFDPGGVSILFTSSDGRHWDSLEVPPNLHIDTVEWIEPHWYFGGHSVGRPAIWRTERLGTWEPTPTDELIFGWSVVALADRDGLVATLSDLAGSAGMREWRQAGGAWSAVSEQPDLPLTARRDGPLATVAGDLWERTGESWTRLEVKGEALSLADGVAVGTDGGQPLIVIQDAGSPPEVSVPQAGDGAWEVVDELGAGPLVGVWPVADGWVIGTETAWWFHDPTDGSRRFTPPWDDGPERIHHLGEEWVALPDLFWTADGTRWETRSQPWLSGRDVPARVEAVTLVPEGILAAGFDQNHLWNVAKSADRGRNWELVAEPRAVTPLWDVVGIDGGFAATAAREQGQREVVMSDLGLDWTPLAQAPGSELVVNSPTPAAVMDDGELWDLDEWRWLPAPRRDIDLVISLDGKVVVARTGDAVWVHDGKWWRAPLDPTHGILGPAFPMWTNGTLQAVVTAGGRLVIQEWEP